MKSKNSLNCSQCPHRQPDWETYYDCDACYECAMDGNPYMPDEDEENETDEADGRAIIID